MYWQMHRRLNEIKLPNVRFKLVTNGNNQNAGIMGWYFEFLFTAADVYSDLPQ